MVAAASRAPSGKRIAYADYKRFLPPELHQDADRVLVYLKTTPFLPIKRCPACSSTRISRNKDKIKLEIPHYVCSNCRKHFCTVSGTPLMSYQHHHLWVAIASCLLSGMPKAHIGKAIGAPIGAFNIRERAIEKVMQENAPKLHQWWITYKYALSQERPPQVEVQVIRFRQWLEDLLHPQNPHCPRCQSPKYYFHDRQKNRASYRCEYCGYKSTFLRNTRLHGLQYTEHIKPFFELLLKAKTGTQIAQVLGITNLLVPVWRRKFSAQMRDIGLDLLADWIVWQHYCRLRNMRQLSVDGQWENAPKKICSTYFYNRSVPEPTIKYPNNKIRE